MVAWPRLRTVRGESPHQKTLDNFLNPESTKAETLFLLNQPRQHADNIKLRESMNLKIYQKHAQNRDTFTNINTK